jgi:hypothetical protein
MFIANPYPPQKNNNTVLMLEGFYIKLMVSACTHFLRGHLQAVEKG